MKRSRRSNIQERERDDDNEYTRMTRRLKTGVEPLWFEIMPYAFFYSVLRSTPEVSRMFQRNLEYTSIYYSKMKIIFLVLQHIV